MNIQQRKELDSRKQIQTHIQECKNFSEGIGSRIDQCEARIADVEDRFTVSDYQIKDLLQLARDHEKSITQLLSDGNSNTRCIGINEKNHNIAQRTLKYAFTEVMAENHLYG